MAESAPAFSTFFAFFGLPIAFLPTGRIKKALEGSDIGSARDGLFHLPVEEKAISGNPWKALGV